MTKITRELQTQAIERDIPVSSQGEFALMMEFKGTVKNYSLKAKTHTRTHKKEWGVLLLFLNMLVYDPGQLFKET